MLGVSFPINKDVENFGAKDSGQNDGDAEVPRVLRLDALARGVADADPQAKKNAGGDKDSVGGYCEAADMKKLRKHRTSLLDAGLERRESGDLVIGSSSALKNEKLHHRGRRGAQRNATEQVGTADPAIERI